MNLARRIELLLFMVVIISVGLAYLGQLAVLACFDRIERENAARDMRRCIAAIEREAHHLETLVADWAEWDDTYAYMNDRNTGYATSTLTSSALEAADLDLLVLVDIDDRLVWGQSRRSSSSPAEQLAEFPTKEWHDEANLRLLGCGDVLQSGLLSTSMGLMLMAASPIRKTNGEGPGRGYLYMGRLIDSDTVQILAQQTDVTFSLRALPRAGDPESTDQNSPEIPSIHSEDTPSSLVLYDYYHGPDGAPVAVVRIEVPTEISTNARIAASMAAASILAANLLLFLFLRLSLRFFVVLPVKKLMEQVVAVCADADKNQRIEAGRADEVERLASEFNRMIERLDDERKRQVRAEEALAESADRQAVLLREANHRVKNNLTVIVSMLHKEEDRAERDGNMDLIPVLRDVIARVFGLSMVHTLLSRNGWRPLRLSELCESVVRAAMQAAPLEKNIQIAVAQSQMTVDSDQAHNVALIMNELATNTVKHAVKSERDLRVRVDIDQRDGCVQLSYQDNGPGYPSSLLQGECAENSIGFDLIRGIATRSLGGAVRLYNNCGAVTVVSFACQRARVTVEV